MGYFRWNMGAAQMRPQSSFLQDLNRDLDQLAALKVISIWTPFDLMIVPSNSSCLPIGRNITVPVLSHAGMITDPRSLAAIAQALTS
jgi:triacylglycerol lipase